MKTLILIILLGVIAMAQIELARPTNEYLVIFDDNQQIIVEGDSFDEALERFKKENAYERIFSVSQRSYVESVWVWQ